MLFLEVAWPPTFPRTNHPKGHKSRQGKSVVSVGDADRDISFTPSEGPSHHRTGQYQAHARGWWRRKVTETKGGEGAKEREK